MNQYAFRIVKNGRADTVYCTASRPSYAWLQVVAHYGAEFTVLPAVFEVLPPHHFAAEIDASDMSEEDAAAIAPRVLPYLRRMVMD